VDTVPSKYVHIWLKNFIQKAVQIFFKNVVLMKNGTSIVAMYNFIKKLNQCKHEVKVLQRHCGLRSSKVNLELAKIFC